MLLADQMLFIVLKISMTNMTWFVFRVWQRTSDIIRFFFCFKDVICVLFSVVNLMLSVFFLIFKIKLFRHEDRVNISWYSVQAVKLEMLNCIPLRFCMALLLHIEKIVLGWVCILDCFSRSENYDVVHLLRGQLKLFVLFEIFLDLLVEIIIAEELLRKDIHILN